MVIGAERGDSTDSHLSSWATNSSLTHIRRTGWTAVPTVKGPPCSRTGRCRCAAAGSSDAVKIPEFRGTYSTGAVGVGATLEETMGGERDASPYCQLLDQEWKWWNCCPGAGSCGHAVEGSSDAVESPEFRGGACSTGACGTEEEGELGPDEHDKPLVKDDFFFD